MCVLYAMCVKTRLFIRLIYMTIVREGIKLPSTSNASKEGFNFFSEVHVAFINVVASQKTEVK